MKPGATAFHHHRREGLRIVEHRAEVDLEHQVPVFHAHTEDELVAGDAGVVDQNVEAAVVLGHPRGHFLRLGEIRSVRSQEISPHALGAKFGEQGVALLVGLQVGENDIGTLLGEEQGMAASDPARSAGDQGGFILKEFHNTIQACRPT